MGRLILALVLVLGACRDGGFDGDSDMWIDGDADAEHGDAAWCSYQAICAGVECSRFGVCEVDITCRPSCLCFVGSHAEGLACVAD